MAKTILLETRTVNFLELVGNGKSFRVPAYQRDYSWQEEQWEDLWNDLAELRHDADQRHYMGALVVEPISDREFQIIDGQQRIATLSILALAVLKQLETLARQGSEPEANRQRASGLRSRFVGETDPASLLEASKLHLNASDDGFYQDYLIQLREPANPRALNHSNRLLWQAIRYFGERLSRAPELQNGEALARLLSETVARQLLFILITVEDDLNAYTVFETLNARGLELSSTDLLKNYLFSRMKAKSDLDAVQRRWRSLVETVRLERFPEFLRYHLATTEAWVRQGRLFKLVRDRVKVGQDVLALLDALERRAELFAALSDPNHEYWRENPAARPYIRELNLFKVRQVSPLLFAGFEQLAPDDFARLLRLVVAISFRYSIIGGLNTNELEPVYHQAAKRLLTGEVGTLAEIFVTLRPIYVEDAKFRADFSEASIPTRGQRKRLAKYVLCRLESELSGRSCDFLEDPGTIEHVLPENAASEWSEDFPPPRGDAYVYRLGNLTLLEAPINRRIGASNFAAKRHGYEESRYRLAQDLATQSPEDWTPDAIEARQQRLAKIATRVWRADVWQ